MNIKLDENLPLRLATLLKDLGHDVHTLHNERLTGHADDEIWEAAHNESRFLITQDLDFSDSRRFAPGKVCNVMNHSNGVASSARLPTRHHQRDAYDAGRAEAPTGFVASVRKN